MFNRFPKFYSGVSLLECLFCLCLSALIFSLTYPNLKAFYLKSEDALVLSQLKEAFRIAHTHAKIQNGPIGLCVSRDNLQCISDLEGHSMLIFKVDQELRLNHLLSIVPLSNQHQTIHARFFPAHQPYFIVQTKDVFSNDNGTFWSCRPNGKIIFAIVLNRSARMRVLLPNKQDEIKDSKGNVLPC